MWYAADCVVDGFDRDRLEEIAANAEHFFGDLGYHLLASFTRGRMFGIFEAERADVVEQWLVRHGITVEGIKPFEIEAERGKILTPA